MLLDGPPVDSTVPFLDLRADRGDSEQSPLRVTPRQTLDEAGTEARGRFVDWMGSINRANASLRWWAHVSAAKNFLTGPLASRVVELLAVERFLATNGAPRVAVVGAVPPLAAALKASPGIAAQWRVADRRNQASSRSFVLARILWQALRAACDLPGLRAARKADAAPEVVIFTYADAKFRDGFDAFFGGLAGRLASRPFSLRVLHVAYIHGAAREVVQRLIAARQHAIEPLFAWLNLADVAWAFLTTLREYSRIRSPRLDAPPLGMLNAKALLQDGLLWDLGPGSYLANLLVYRAACRMSLAHRPTLLLYPFENKALEKMLLLGTRRSSERTRIVGYQHTSITPRHATFLFAEGEAQATPLPDRVVTIGEVTRGWLERYGRYPSDFFATGGSLRQSLGEKLPRRPRDGRIRLLLAFSSSLRELREGLRMARAAAAIQPRLLVAVRPHPEFPIDRLGGALPEWVRREASDASESSLADNLAWCDAVAYCSSTVALEALGRGRPTIKLDLNELIDPDPVLDPVAFRWTAATPSELAHAAAEVVALDEREFEVRSDAGRAYVARYLRPASEEAIEALLDGAALT